MTLDNHPKRWRQMAKLFVLWLDLSENEAGRLIDALPEVEQDRFDAFLFTKKTPQKSLKELEAGVKKGDLNLVLALIDKLPRPELEKLVKSGLKKGKLIDNVSKMNVDELRLLVSLCSFPKNMLAHIIFNEWIDTKRKGLLLG